MRWRITIHSRDRWFVAAVALLLGSAHTGCRCASKPSSQDRDASTSTAPSPIDASVPADAKRYREARRKMGQLPPCDDSNDAFPRPPGAYSTTAKYTCRPVLPASDFEGWGYKMGWLAVSTYDAPSVARALDLEVEAASWNRGIAYAYSGGSTFITPPIEGWTLVIGSWLLEADARNLESLAIDLSAEFGETQVFVTHRYFEYHGFVLAQSGQLKRSLVYDGEKHGIVRDEGHRLPVEDEIDRKHVTTIMSPDGRESVRAVPLMTPTGMVRTTEPLSHDLLAESLIVRLASKLSLDPTEMSRAMVGDADGWMGPARNLE